MSISWGIIGAGDVCEIKSGPAFNLIEGSQLTAVMRRDGAMARDYAQRHGVPKWYDDADALINDPDITAVYIATPPDSHEEYTHKVAAAGKPVYVEKPMAMSYDQCINMVNACAHAGVPLYVAYYRRALANFLAIKRWLEEGTIGDVRFVEIQLHKSIKQDLSFKNKGIDHWRTDPVRSGGGYFNDLASHQLDIMDMLFGPIVHARAYHLNQAGVYAADDIVLGQFQFEGGMPGQGSWCFTTSPAAEKEVTTIYGSKGTISFPYFGDSSVTIHLDGQVPVRHTFDVPKNIQHSLIQTIVDDLRGRGTCPSTGESAARTNRVMDWMIS
ncbi:MAG: Gfo/Idh/MocA family oxidoreductase [Saprospiraceae bacterium]|nr:Gfo/Idh/MocA family oxidoreductase [Saprospiraceae bacterium]